MYAKLILMPILLIGACAGHNQNLNENDDTYKKLLKSIFKANATDSYSSHLPCGAGKVCVPQHLCSSNRSSNTSIITNGETIIDIRIDAIKNNPCEFLEVCCATSDTVDEPYTTSNQAPKGCGFRNENGVAGLKILKATDNEAEFGEFPWMVAILETRRNASLVNIIFKCGGSLITPAVVLTAAHCVNNVQAQNLKIRIGEWDTHSKKEPLAYQEIQVNEIISHENFNSGSLYNDIALLFLKTTCVMAQHINTVCLPPAGTNFDMSRCFVTGWGKDILQNGKFPNILKKIEVPVVSNADCQRNLRETRLTRYFELHSSFICAGGEPGKDACRGDGGSPLVCPMSNNPNSYFQAGIVAWGIGCGTENVPGVYASISHLRPWIDYQLAKKGIDLYTP